MAPKAMLHQALNTPMTRKQFLIRIGIVMLAFVGLRPLLHALTSNQQLSNSLATPLSQPRRNSYGS